jgi:hypothetical protein
LRRRKNQKIENSSPKGFQFKLFGARIYSVLLFSFRILDFSFFCGPEENLLTGAEHGDVLQTAVDVQFKDTPLPKNR